MATTGEVRQSTFVKVIVIVLVVVAGMGILIHFLNAGHHRPEGAAEHWLSDISDSGRKGLSSEAKRQAEKIGPVDIAAPLLPATHDSHHSDFDDLEVGKALPAGLNTVRVPFRLHEHDQSGSAALRKGTLVLQHENDGWHVVALDTRRSGEKVASEGGPRPSRAPFPLWLGAIGVGLLLALFAHLITRYAERSADRALGSSATPNS
ncbi:MAG: hypothetical protein JO148_09905 [Acidimicrobiia bacterium]|nr:hypothetical protein [Acidimicrobiia bacterium]